MPKLRPRLALLVAGVLLLGACANDSTDDGDPVDPDTPRLVKADTLTICTTIGSKPWIFSEDGEIQGFDIELVELVATKLGVTPEISVQDFAQISTGAVFEAAKCDIAAAAITVTEARQQIMSFSDSYFDTNQMLLVLQESPVNGLEDLEGKRLAVQTDTTGQIYAQAHESEYGYEIVIFEDMPSTVLAVMSDKADAALWDNAGLIPAVQQYPETRIAAEYVTGETYAWAMSKNNPGLLKVANEALSEARQDGTYDTIYKKWLSY
ncbi:MAG: ABC transporter substrate-binding protein [Propionibacteriaceae bacterium]|nr:ABC transporter substrate-binding protein [Propionibacteriaceae bacterium]